MEGIKENIKNKLYDKYCYYMRKYLNEPERTSDYFLFLGKATAIGEFIDDLDEIMP